MKTKEIKGLDLLRGLRYAVKMPSYGLKVTTSFRISKDVRRRFNERVPRRGDRASVLEELIKLFLAGKVAVARSY